MTLPRSSATDTPTTWKCVTCDFAPVVPSPASATPIGLCPRCGQSRPLMPRVDAETPIPAPWEVRDNYDRLREGERLTFSIMRGAETAAKCWDYGLACVIEATLNLRDGTVE